MPHQAQPHTVVALKDSYANPAPLGLLGFGLTTVLLNLHNAGLLPMSAMILSMGIFYGGLAQIIAGIMECRKCNTFAGTAFISYGIFWLTLVGLKVMPVLGMADPADGRTMGAFLFMWGLFTLVMFLGTLQISRALQIVFGSLTVLFLLLAIGDFTGNHGIIVFAGFEGILCGFAAIYTGLAQVLNEVYGRVVLPIGPVAKAARA